MTTKRNRNPTYCFIDVDLKSRQIIVGYRDEGQSRGASDTRLSPSVPHDRAIQQAGDEARGELLITKEELRSFTGARRDSGWRS
jgi:hypothetical protein